MKVNNNKLNSHNNTLTISNIKTEIKTIITREEAVAAASIETEETIIRMRIEEVITSILKLLRIMKKKWKMNSMRKAIL